MKQMIGSIFILLSACTSYDSGGGATTTAGTPVQSSTTSTGTSGTENPGGAAMSNNEGAVSYRILASGSNGAAASSTVEVGRRAPFVELARSSAQFQAKWSEHIGSDPLPRVDFATESVVFLLLGPRSTGGYSIKTTAARREGSSVKIAADLIEPPPDAIVTQAFTAPYVVLAVSDRSFKMAEWINQGSLLAQNSFE